MCCTHSESMLGMHQFRTLRFLPACSRCCYTCLCSAPEMAATTLTTARWSIKILGLQRKALNKIPIVTTLPGVYTLNALARKRSLRVLSLAKLFALAGSSATEDKKSLLVSQEDLTRHPSDPLRFMVATPLPYLDVRWNALEDDVWCRGCELTWYREHWGGWNESTSF